jgi:hypothetical protein
MTPILEHRRAAEIRHEHRRLDRSLPFRQPGFSEGAATRAATLMLI